jgi:hypothetical protein
MERLQEEERPNVNNGGKISDDQQTYPYNDWLALETEAEAAALAHFARVLPTYGPSLSPVLRVYRNWKHLDL